MNEEREYRIQFLHRILTEDSHVGDVSLSNYFIIEFPEFFNLQAYDFESVTFLDDNVCRFVIRNNFSNYPLFTINEYIKNKQKCLFSKCNDKIFIKHLDRYGKVRYSTELSNIKIVKVYESELTYKSDNIQTITLDVKYKNRTIEKF